MHYDDNMIESIPVGVLGLIPMSKDRKSVV